MALGISVILSCSAIAVWLYQIFIWLKYEEWISITVSNILINQCSTITWYSWKGIENLIISSCEFLYEINLGVFILIFSFFFEWVSGLIENSEDGRAETRIKRLRKKLGYENQE